jgi:hypothetical protein
LIDYDKHRRTKKGTRPQRINDWKNSRTAVPKERPYNGVLSQKKTGFHDMVVEAIGSCSVSAELFQGVFQYLVSDSKYRQKNLWSDLITRYRPNEG